MLSLVLYVQGRYILWQTHRFKTLDSQLLRKYLPETVEMSDWWEMHKQEHHSLRFNVKLDEAFSTRGYTDNCLYLCLVYFKKIVINFSNIASIFAVETSPLWCIKCDWINRRVSHSRICECSFPLYFSQCLWWFVIKAETCCTLNNTTLLKYSSDWHVQLCIQVASNCWITANYELERMWKEAVMS